MQMYHLTKIEAKKYSTFAMQQLGTFEQKKSNKKISAIFTFFWPNRVRVFKVHKVEFRENNYIEMLSLYRCIISSNLMESNH